MLGVISLLFSVASLIVAVLIIRAFFQASRAVVILACKADHGHGKESTLHCDCACHPHVALVDLRVPHAPSGVELGPRHA